MATSATLITVAPTGAEIAQSAAPALPVSLEKLVETARACEAAGAAVIHVHIRDDQAEPTIAVPQLTETVAALRAHTGLVIQLSTGGAVSDSEADRFAVLEALPDAASCSMGTLNFGDDVFLNRWPFIVEIYRRMRERAIVPELECFDLGQVQAVHRLLAAEGEPYGGHVHVDLVMGVPGGMPGTPETLAAAVALLPTGASFSATGVGKATLPVALAALAHGGHLRVGMEDTLSFGPGQPVRDNAQLVERAADLARLAQRPPMSASAARTWLGIRVLGT